MTADEHANMDDHAEAKPYDPAQLTPASNAITWRPAPLSTVEDRTHCVCTRTAVASATEEATFTPVLFSTSALVGERTLSTGGVTSTVTVFSSKVRLPAALLA